jgi:cutinase
LTILVARGTDEPRALKYGIIVGDPLFRATKKLIPGITGYSVQYPANFDCDSRQIGIDDTIAHIKNASIACPLQKFVLAGYSQGGDVIHWAAAGLDPSLYPRIIATTMYGDPANKGPGVESPTGGIPPQFPAALQAKTRENCVEKDPVSAIPPKI